MQTNFDTDKFKDFKFYGLPNAGNTSSFNIRISEKDRIAKQDILTNGTAIKSNGKNLFFAIRIANKYTCDNLTIKPMLVPANYEYNKYIQNEQTDYILNIQQEMLQGDYFVKEEDGWKEVHNWKKIILDGKENWMISSLNTEGFNNFYVQKILEGYISLEDDIEMKLTHFVQKPFENWAGLLLENFAENSSGNLGIRISQNIVENLESFKTWLSLNNIIVFYKAKEPTKLVCTEKQSIVLDELNNLDLFRPTVNIITTENIALLKLKYVVDTKTYVDNKYNNLANQILDIAGGN